MLFLWSVLSNLKILNFHCVHLPACINLHIDRPVFLYGRDQQTLCGEGQVVNVLGFVALLSWFQWLSRPLKEKAAIGNGCGCVLPAGSATGKQEVSLLTSTLATLPFSQQPLAFHKS